MLDASSAIKQLVILSGKGGTGKTSLSAAFAHLVTVYKNSISAVFADADVDAANLALVLQPDLDETHDFWGGSLAEINAGQCTGCGSCVSVCRYDAIFPAPNLDSVFRIDPIACDGCAACVYACPQGAIRMAVQQEGQWFRSTTPYGTLFHAELFPGKENSGKLVTLVKQQARLWADDMHSSLVIIDGPPGIGCPVISACAGADLGLIVTEPGVAGFHDLKRALGVLNHFQIPAVACINKADISPQGVRLIREYAAEQGIDVIGEIPFDENVHRAMLQGAPITRVFPESLAAWAINQIFEKLVKLLLP